MFQLLYPLGLLAALGIIVPVIVHLWNIKNGKTLKIGSIALLGSPSNQRSRNLKVTDWPLLLIRCILLLLVSLLLALPVYRTKQITADRPGWIVVERALLKEVWTKHKRQLDSLLSKGYQLHDLALKFPLIDLKDTATVFSKPSTTGPSYFSMLRHLDQSLGAGFKVYLYTGNQLSRFSGALPVTQLALHWQLASVDDSLKTTWPVGGLTAHSSAAGTYYSPVSTFADTVNQEIAIYESSKSGGASYVRAAVLAIADFTKHKVHLRTVQTVEDIKKPGTFIFWLSDERLTDVQLKGLAPGTTVFAYAGAKPFKLKSQILKLRGDALDETQLYQRTATTEKAGVPVWTDGFGEPLLVETRELGVHLYKFYSRFSPQWTSMVWSNGMLMAMLPVLNPDPAAIYGFKEDERYLNAVSTTSIAGISGSSEKGITPATSYETKAIENYIWWLLFIVFIAERWLSYRKTRQGI
ncbi:BatA domain-containing protein [Pedobacter duraquae]|uniref:Putative membrane protein (TIGR02226 family) n=1 Tax=Pedobacter duraquae TaxID=425511 RepID=A0A4R6IL93_9SPHI|nr:BatA domain-containing protein [Pedobacter duraquae]TDO22853.1 putative membrane protein (TIGR02226 family) [Pedobacter duraquae]